MDDRRPARAGAQNPAYSPARPPLIPHNHQSAGEEFNLGRSQTERLAIAQTRAGTAPVRRPLPSGTSAAETWVIGL